ncbi:MAG: polyprenyl synthetase family protein [Candidatus Aminicenantaceae bacterium]
MSYERPFLSSSSIPLPKNIPDLETLYASIKKDLDEVEEQLKFFSQSRNKLISEISAYLFKNAGKRIRPALLVLCSKLFDYQGKEHILMSALVETIHTASLIHDDVIDNSERRRGRQSVHSRWGPNVTVLLGDYLYIKSIGLSLQSSYRQIIHILTEISARMIEGELTEYCMSGNLDIAEKDYLDIINKKTASLFSASCQIGGVIGRASEEEENFLVNYGTNLGMSFQMVDDLLDFTGKEEVLGKPILSDLKEGRITLPLIYTMENDGKANREHIIEILSQKKYKEKDSQKKILKILKSNGAFDYTFDKAREFSQKSKEIISQFPQSIHRDTLTFLPDFVLTRKK